MSSDTTIDRVLATSLRRGKRTPPPQPPGPPPADGDLPHSNTMTVGQITATQFGVDTGVPVGALSTGMTGNDGETPTRIAIVASNTGRIDLQLYGLTIFGMRNADGVSATVINLSLDGGAASANLSLNSGVRYRNNSAIAIYNYLSARNGQQVALDLEFVS